MTLGAKIKALRLKEGLSQEALATALKTTKQAIYKYENGIVTNIPMDKISIIASVLNTTPAYLMGWEEKENTPDKQTLVEGEEEWVSLFRLIPVDQRDEALVYVRSALKIAGLLQ